MPGRWRSALVRPAGGGDRRRAGDVVRLLAGSVGASLLFALTTRVPVGDRGLVRWLSDLGWNLQWVGTTGRWLLVVVVPALVVVIAVTTGSWRLLLSAATAAVTSVLVVLALVPFTQPPAARQQELDAFAIPSHFPLFEVAVPLAILAVAGAFLARPARRFLGVLVTVGLIGFLIGEQALLLDVAASALAGWAAAGLAGLVFGSPVGDATPSEVERGLSELGVSADDVVPTGHAVWGSARYGARVDGGAVLVDVHGREAEDARALQRTWHAIIDKGGPARLAVGRREQAEHEALCLGLAERAGVPVPDLVAVGAVGPAADGYVVFADGGAQSLRDVDDESVSDDLLRSAWQAVASCHRAGLAHRLLDTSAMQVRPDGSVQLTDWFAARPAAGQDECDRDVATFLLTTAAKTDPTRAVTAAIDVLGPDALARALPLCQLAVLDARARDRLNKHVAADVRTAAADALGTKAPDLAELRRVSWSDILMIGGTVLGFWLLYSQLASLDDLWATLADADWAWAIVVVVLAQVSVVFTAIALQGAVVQRLPLGQLVALEYADLFTGLVGGTVAITATNIRYFQRQGLPGTTAVTSGVVSSLAGGVIQAVIVVVALPFLLTSGRLQLGDAGGGGGDGGGGGSFLVTALLVVALVSGIALLIPRFRRSVAAKVKPQIHTAMGDVRDLVRRPRQLVTMLSGQAASQVVLALALGASLRAFGGSLPFVDLLVINTFAALIGGLAPVPGGMGAVEAGLIGGFTAFGVDPTQAGAATFLYRLFTAYLPPAWGWPTMAWMRRRELL